MRIASTLFLLGLLALTTGCSSNPPRGPLFSGKLESGTFWKAPLTTASNEGGDYAKGSRVDVYEQFVVVTTSDGLSHVHPHGNYSNLAIKRE